MCLESLIWKASFSNCINPLFVDQFFLFKLKFSPDTNKFWFQQLLFQTPVKFDGVKSLHWSEFFSVNW
jgi:hypothetical protein